MSEPQRLLDDHGIVWRQVCDCPNIGKVTEKWGKIVCSICGKTWANEGLRRVEPPRE